MRASHGSDELCCPTTTQVCNDVQAKASALLARTVTLHVRPKFDVRMRRDPFDDVTSATQWRPRQTIERSICHVLGVVSVVQVAPASLVTRRLSELALDVDATMHFEDVAHEIAVTEPSGAGEIGTGVFHVTAPSMLNDNRAVADAPMSTSAHASLE